MDFCSDVPEAKQASGDYWDWVAFVIHPREIRHLRVKERGPGMISNTWRPKRESLDSRAFRQVKRHEQRVKFRDPSAKRVTDLWVQYRRRKVQRPDGNELR